MATFIVNTTQDEFDGSIEDGDISLRDAIAAANETAGADTIAFDPTVFDGEAGVVLRLTQGQIAITEALTINGGAGVTITGDANGDDVTLAGGITDVDASLAGEDRLDDNSRIFDATAALTLDGLTLTGGRTTADEDDGGAVRSTAPLTLIESTVSGNSIAGYRSGGGGIHSGSAITVTDSTISDNHGGYRGQGAGISGDTVIVTNSTVSGNRTAGYVFSHGGGIFSRGDVTVMNSTVSGNDAGASGGGIISFGGSVTVTDSIVSGNDAYGDGGGIAGGTVTLTNSTVSDNSAFYAGGSSGGGIDGGTVTVMDSTISGNSARDGGGGIYGGTVTVTNSTVGGNSGNRGSGGVQGGEVTVTNSTISGNDGYYGGVLGGGTITVTSSTISGNDGDYGGGITGGAVTITNSTITGNYSSSGNGGIHGGDVAVTNSTISGNYGEEYGGIHGFQTVSLSNSIVLGNMASDGVGDEVVAGALVRTGGNILGTDVYSGDTDVGETSAAAVFAETAEIAPGVFAGVLADNGGPTETIALRLVQGNPAIGGADPATAAATDQRGVARDADPDLGAFEAVFPHAQFRIEAETLVLVSGFKVVNHLAASDGMLIKSPDAAVEAHAKFTFTGQDGVYDLDLGYFDENDGEASLAVLVDGVEVDSWLFDQNHAHAKVPAVRHIADVAIETGDVVELVGHRDGGEPLRTDFLDFTYVDDLVT
jgi:predicted outer membrane repeat protein